MNDGTLVTLFGMAAVTYVTRILGFYLSGRITALPPALEQALNYIPGTIIVSIIAPQILTSGKAGFITALVCIGAAIRLKNIVAVMIVGVATISMLRHFTFL